MTTFGSLGTLNMISKTTPFFFFPGDGKRRLIVNVSYAGDASPPGTTVAFAFIASPLVTEVNQF